MDNSSFIVVFRLKPPCIGMFIDFQLSCLMTGGYILWRRFELTQLRTSSLARYGAILFRL